MEDERIVPVPVSVYKAEVWRHLGFCSNVRLGSAACRVPCWTAFQHGCSFLSCWGRFVQLGRCSRLANCTWNINTNWKTCEIQVERFWECSTSVFILLFSLEILQALYLSRCNFLFRSKCYDIVCHNCKLKLLTFKAGSKNIYGLFYKIHFVHIHLTKESCKHPWLVLHKKWFNNVTGTDCCKCRSQFVLVKQFLFIYFLLRLACGGVFLMTAFLKIYPIPKIRKISQYIALLTVSQYIVSWYVSYRQILANTQP